MLNRLLQYAGVLVAILVQITATFTIILPIVSECLAKHPPSPLMELAILAGLMTPAAIVAVGFLVWAGWFKYIKDQRTVLSPIRQDILLYLGTPLLVATVVMVSFIALIVLSLLASDLNDIKSQKGFLMALVSFVLIPGILLVRLKNKAAEPKEPVQKS